jgi:hypothetical protein
MKIGAAFRQGRKCRIEDQTSLLARPVSTLFAPGVQRGLVHFPRVCAKVPIEQRKTRRVKLPQEAPSNIVLNGRYDGVRGW